MNLRETIRLALENTRSNKMRSILTMLGIIIGISSVITITTIGSSMQATVAASLRQFGGVNTISCYVDAIWPESEDEWQTFIWPETAEEDRLTLEDLQLFAQSHPSEIAQVIVSQMAGSATYKSGENTANVELFGTTGGTLDQMNLKLLAGRDIQMNDCLLDKRTAVVSDWFVKYGCDGKSPIGQRIDVTTDTGDMRSVYVVGVYEYDAKKMGTAGEKVKKSDVATVAYISYPTALMPGSSTGIESFDVVTTDATDPIAFSPKIDEYFTQHKYGADGKFHIATYDMASELESINSILSGITVAISVIAAISLLVGGIGVMNIMLVSVVERTREIGIRKALGARARTIQFQFLTESVVICLIGGLLGIFFGLLGGFIFTTIGGQILQSSGADIMELSEIAFHPSVPAILISVGFSCLIGIAFGFYPAKRAAALHPIDALRYE